MSLFYLRYGGEEGGVYEWEGDGTEAFDLYDDMLVGADAPGVTDVAGERAGGYADFLAYMEIGLAVKFTLYCRVVGGK